VRLSAVVGDLASDLTTLGTLGDDAMADAAKRLAAAMPGPLTARLLELLGQAAAELEGGEPGTHVQVRLVGDDVHLVVIDPDPAAETSEPERHRDTDAPDSRITLRLSATLKARVEAASDREGVSVNTWIGRALSQQLRDPRPSRMGRRLKGYGQS
jgi:hypothetical protein